MTTEQLDKSFETGRLQLSTRDKFSHFGIVFFLCIAPSVLLTLHLTAYLQGLDASFKDGEIGFILVPPFLAVIFYMIQRERLRFRLITTSLKWDELMKLIKQIEKELNWIRVSSNKRIYIARTNPGFFSGSWGEQITILFDTDRILINSICDPKQRLSITSMGRNRENVNALQDAIQKASKIQIPSKSSIGSLRLFLRLFS